MHLRQARQVLGTVQEAYEFFTLHFEPDPQCEKEKKRMNVTDKGDERCIKGQDGALVDEGKGEGRGKEPPPQRRDKIDLFSSAQLSRDLLQVKKPEYVRYKNSDLVFVPSRRTVPDSVKLPKNKKDRGSA